MSINRQMPWRYNNIRHTEVEETTRIILISKRHQPITAAQKALTWDLPLFKGQQCAAGTLCHSSMCSNNCCSSEELDPWQTINALLWGRPQHWKLKPGNLAKDLQPSEAGLKRKEKLRVRHVFRFLLNCCTWVSVRTAVRALFGSRWELCSAVVWAFLIFHIKDWACIEK